MEESQRVYNKKRRLQRRREQRALELSGKQPCCVACVASLACVAGLDITRKGVFKMLRCTCGRLLMVVPRARYVLPKACPLSTLAEPATYTGDLCNACFDKWMAE